MLKEITNLNHSLEAAEPAGKKRKVQTKSLTDLEPSIIKQILSHLVCPDLLCLSFVSHKCHEIVSTHANPLKNPIFVPDVSVKDISSYLAACKKAKITNVGKVTIHEGDTKLKVAVLKKLMSSKLQIEALDISTTHFVDFDSLAKLAAGGKPNAFESVKSLRIQIAMDKKCYMGEFLARCLPNLENLAIEVTTGIHKISMDEGYLNFGDICFNSLKTFKFEVVPDRGTNRLVAKFAKEALYYITPRRVEHLVFSGFDIVDGDLEDIIAQADPEVLELNIYQLFADEMMSCLKRNNVHPRHLTLRGGYDRDFETERYQGALSSLESLEYGHTIEVTWRMFSQILDLTEGHLKRLTLFADKTLFGTKDCLNFVEMLQKCPDLEVLDMSKCESFTSEWCEKLEKAVRIVRLEKLRIVRVSSYGPSRDSVTSLAAALPPHTQLHLLNTPFPPDAYKD